MRKWPNVSLIDNDCRDLREGTGPLGSTGTLDSRNLARGEFTVAPGSGEFEARPPTLAASATEKATQESPRCTCHCGSPFRRSIRRIASSACCATARQIQAADLGRIGILSKRSLKFSRIDSGSPLVSLPKTKISPAHRPLRYRFAWRASRKTRDVAAGDVSSASQFGTTSNSKNCQ